MEGFTVAAELPPDEENEGLGLHFHRVDAPRIDDINDLTIRLLRLAQEFAGEYAGWETAVIESPTRPLSQQLGDVGTGEAL